MFVLLQIIGLSLPFLFPLVLAYMYGSEYAKSVGLTSDEVKTMNEKLSSGRSIDLEVEEMSYIFKRDFAQEIAQFRAENLSRFNSASLSIASL